MTNATNDVPPRWTRHAQAGDGRRSRGRMTIPANMNAQWIATLGDAELVMAEARLHADFREGEAAEKSRSGSRYVLGLRAWPW